jgi:hypothetical protein
MIFFLIILLLNEKAAEWQEYGAGQGWVKLAKLALWMVDHHRFSYRARSPYSPLPTVQQQ